jgi:hypothetical protein
MEVGSVNLYLIPWIVLSMYLIFQGHETDAISGEGNDRSSRSVGRIYTWFVVLRFPTYLLDPPGLWLNLQTDFRVGEGDIMVEND